MLIQAVNKQKKSLVEVIVDGESFLIDRETFSLSGYQVGKEITNAEIDELITKSENHRAKEKALWLLSRRDYSKTELLKKLKCDASDEAAEQTAERMEEVGLINDTSYAKRYASDLFHIKQLSNRMVLYELTGKGIDKELAREVIEELAVKDEETIAALVQRKFPVLESEKEIRRAHAYLLRKGYSYGLISGALKNHTKEEI